MRHLHQFLIRPYIYNELPGWGSLYSQVVGDYRRDGDWQGLAPRTIRGKLHGYQMELELGKWSDRVAYFLGRHYDLPTQLLLKATLRSGDRCVDIGANIGMITLLASAMVGSEGRVDAVEPNPSASDRLKAAVQRNSIQNVVLHEVAVGDREGVATLSIPEWNSGEASLLAMQPEHGCSVRTIAVPIRLSGSILSLDPRPPKLIKIDVEGFELSVLSGMYSFLAKSKPLVVTEVVAEHLRRAGSSAKAVFDLMQNLGYRPFGISSQRHGLRQALKLLPCNPANHPTDVAWVSPGSPVSSLLSTALPS